jgi:hypothetical protein
MIRPLTVRNAFSWTRSGSGLWRLTNPLLSSLVSALLCFACSTSPSGDVSDEGGSGGRPALTGGTTGTSTISTGTGGASSSALGPDCAAITIPPANPDDLISDFEDGFGHVNQSAPNRGGGFYAFNDGKGTQTPDADPSGTGAAPAAVQENHCTGSYVFCTSGSGFTTWGAGIGTDVGKAPAPYDASGYSGIAFQAKSNKGPVSMMVKFPDKDTAPEGGVCDKGQPDGAKACYCDWSAPLSLTTEWQAFTISFSKLTQPTWGLQATAFDPTTLYRVQWQTDKNIDFDYCIDNLVFVK